MLLVTGIANPGSMKNLLLEKSKTYYEMLYSDHHIFTIDDLKDIKKRFFGITAANKIILTTEKDAVRLVKFEQELHDIPLYVMPIELQFLFNDENRFNELIGTFIREFNRKPKWSVHCIVHPRHCLAITPLSAKQRGSAPRMRRDE